MIIALDVSSNDTQSKIIKSEGDDEKGLDVIKVWEFYSNSSVVVLKERVIINWFSSSLCLADGKWTALC